MHLLTFAHKNEASSFLHYHDFKESAHVKNLYFDGKNYLLITGEGLWDALTSTMQSLGTLNTKNAPPITVCNLGVAGALRASIKKFSLFSINTSYAFSSQDNPEFHSYTSTSASNLLVESADCVSSYKRNTSIEEKNLLSPFAPLVDRELWSIAKAATSYNTNWSALKIVSDELSEENSCQLIQNLSQEFSSRLYETWRSLEPSLLDTKKVLNPEVDANQHLLEVLHQQSLYLTFSQKHQIFDLVARILKQENVSLEQLVKEVPFDNWLKSRPKDKSHLLVQWLRLRLTPQLGTHAAQIQQWMRNIHLQNKNLQISTIDDFEAIEIKFRSFNTQDWKEILSTLNSIQRQEFDQILKGSHL
jgi:hypothetical protein